MLPQSFIEILGILLIYVLNFKIRLDLKKIFEEILMDATIVFAYLKYFLKNTTNKLR